MSNEGEIKMTFEGLLLRWSARLLYSFRMSYFPVICRSDLITLRFLNIVDFFFIYLAVYVRPREFEPAPINSLKKIHRIQKRTSNIALAIQIDKRKSIRNKRKV